MPELGRGPANVDHDVEYRAGDHADQLALRMWRKLIVQPTHDALGRDRMIVLHEAMRPPGRGLEQFLVVAFEKHASRVAEDLWFKQHDVVEGQSRRFIGSSAPGAGASGHRCEARRHAKLRPSAVRCPHGRKLP